MVWAATVTAVVGAGAAAYSASQQSAAANTAVQGQQNAALTVAGQANQGAAQQLPYTQIGGAAANELGFLEGLPGYNTPTGGNVGTANQIAQMITSDFPNFGPSGSAGNPQGLIGQFLSTVPGYLSSGRDQAGTAFSPGTLQQFQQIMNAINSAGLNPNAPQTAQNAPQAAQAAGLPPGMAQPAAGGIAPVGGGGNQAPGTGQLTANGVIPPGTINSVGGAGGPPGAPLPGQAATPAAMPAGGAATPAGGYGSLFAAFNPQNLQNTPGYQFQLGQGIEALTNQDAAAGTYMGANTAKDLINYAEGLAGTTYNTAFAQDMSQKQNIYNMLSGNTVLGQGATQSVVGNNSNAAQNIAGTQINAANTLANAGLSQSGQLTNNLTQLAGLGTLATFFNKTPTTTPTTPVDPNVFMG